MTKPRLLITRRWPAEAEDAAHAAFDVTLNEGDAPMSAEALTTALREYNFARIESIVADDKQRLT